MNKNSKYNYEINILELITLIWREKIKIFLITVLSIIIMVAYLEYQDPVELSYETSTKLQPISLFDEFEYESYNKFIKDEYLSTSTEVYDFYTKSLQKKEIVDKNFIEIDRTYLFKLFIEKINSENYLSNLIIKSNLISQDSYSNEKEYKLDVLDFANRIEFAPDKNDELEDSWTMQTKSGATIKDKKKWESFLKLVEKNTNDEIQSFLQKKFNSFILNKKRAVNFKIEDINIQLSNIKTEDEINFLENKVRLLESYKNSERLKSFFNSTPVNNPSHKFYAGKIMYQSTEFKNISKKTNTKIMIFRAVILGFLFGIIFVFFANFRKR